MSECYVSLLPSRTGLWSVMVTWPFGYTWRGGFVNEAQALMWANELSIALQRPISHG